MGFSTPPHGAGSAPQPQPHLTQLPVPPRVLLPWAMLPGQGMPGRECQGGNAPTPHLPPQPERSANTQEQTLRSGSWRRFYQPACRAEQHRDLSLSTLSSALVLPKGCHGMEHPEHPPWLWGCSCPADTELINAPIPQQPIFGTNTAISSQQRGASG